MLTLNKNKIQLNVMHISKRNLDYIGNISFLKLAQFTMKTDPTTLITI